MDGAQGEGAEGDVVRILTTEQRTPEWFAARIGKFTASRASDMMATIKSGEAAARRDLRVQIVCERLTGASQEDTYVNATMQRGVDKEPDAFGAYEALTGHLARQVGFLAHDTLPAGCSPDGVIGEFEGLLECKCPKTATHLSYLKSKAVPKDYFWQIQHSLWITGAQWCDFVSFDDRLPPGLQVFRVRVQRNEAEINSYELMARAFLSEIDKECDELAKLAEVVAA
jgi:putative phage-type endonuclease